MTVHSPGVAVAQTGMDSTLLVAIPVIILLGMVLHFLQSVEWF